MEVDLKEKGTALHQATVVGDTVGDPFKDTTSVALNPIIKFSTLFGLLAVEIAVSIKQAAQDAVTSRSGAWNYGPVVGDVMLLIAAPDLRLAFVLQDADSAEGCREAGGTIDRLARPGGGARSR